MGGRGVSLGGNCGIWPFPHLQAVKGWLSLQRSLLGVG